MKSFLALFALICSFQLAAQSLNQVDANGKKQGPWQKTFPKTKVVEYKGQFKDDKPVGTFYYYYPDAKVKAVIVHDAATGRSAATMYHESGVVLAKGIYRNQLKDSVWNYYGPSGRMSMKESYSKNLLHGQSIIYYVPESPENRNVMAAKVSNYVNGVLEGDVTEYFDTGVIKSKGKYVAGKREGLFTINHTGGTKMILERYKNGVRHGWCATYDEKGVEKGKKYFYHGKEVKGEELEAKLKYYKEKGIDPNNAK